MPRSWPRRPDQLRRQLERRRRHRAAQGGTAARSSTRSGRSAPTPAPSGARASTEHRGQHPAPQGQPCGRRPHGTNAFDPSIEWDGFAIDTFDGLGAHAPLQRHAARRRSPGGHGRHAGRRRIRVRPGQPDGDLQRAVWPSWRDHPGVLRHRRRAADRHRWAHDVHRRPGPRLADGETCTLTVLAAGVSDPDSNDPPDTMVTNFTSTFTVALSSCVRVPVTPIPAIQGSRRRRAAITGTVTTAGVVVGDYEGPSPGAARLLPPGPDRRRQPSHLRRHLRLQRHNDDRRRLGDVVAVTGTAGEFQGQTQISAPPRHRRCGTGTVDADRRALPVASPDLPRTVRRHARAPAPDPVRDRALPARSLRPGRLVRRRPAGAADQRRRARRRRRSRCRREQPEPIILDDASQAQNPDPILFARGGQPAVGRATRCAVATRPPASSAS